MVGPTKRRTTVFHVDFGAGKLVSKGKPKRSLKIRRQQTERMRELDDLHRRIVMQYPLDKPKELVNWALHVERYLHGLPDAYKVRRVRPLLAIARRALKLLPNTTADYFNLEEQIKALETKRLRIV
ncbi:MAG: hypothetical protein COT14_01005 [Candidatus Diapherotrites archaeon CG08_land_8_20_14_0_20_30_16]|nr:MAG: hypothetical protein COT14_01005 [Candidatus Diapherotrites archaeon CG08_land_8_20_14_0_20_30_16]